MRALRIALSGFGVLALLLCVVTWPYPSAFALGVAILLFVSAGFLVRPHPAFVLSLPAFEPGEPLPILSGASLAEQFPQGLVFTVAVRLLWLLAVGIVLSMVFGSWAFIQIQAGHRDLFGESNPMFQAGIFIVALTATMAVVWLRERILLRTGTVALGAVYRQGDYFMYEYFDVNGERHGGLALPAWASFGISNVTLVFFRPASPEDSKPGFEFLFHKFRLVDKRHLPAVLKMFSQR